MGFKERSKSIVLLPQDRLDAQGGMKLQQQLAAIDPDQHHFWIVDMSPVEFIDSSGLVALVAGLNLARQQQCRLAICNLGIPVRLILEITQLDRVFEIFESHDAALASLRTDSLPFADSELAVA